MATFIIVSNGPYGKNKLRFFAHCNCFFSHLWGFNGEPVLQIAFKVDKLWVSRGLTIRSSWTAIHLAEVPKTKRPVHVLYRLILTTNINLSDIPVLFIVRILTDQIYRYFLRIYFFSHQIYLKLLMVIKNEVYVLTVRWNFLAMKSTEGPCLMRLLVLEKSCISQIFALCKFLAILFH